MLVNILRKLWYLPEGSKLQCTIEIWTNMDFGTSAVQQSATRQKKRSADNVLAWVTSRSIV